MLEFGTGGFRGIIADDFNKKNIQLIGQAMSDYYKEHGFTKPIYVGYDYRFLSDYAARWLCEVLAGNGIQVCISNEATTTPEIMFICKDEGTELGAMITASHNPSIYNGVKLFQKEGMDAEVSLTQSIEKRINELVDTKWMDFEKAYQTHQIQKVSILERYMNHIFKFLLPIEQETKLRVLVDPLYGTGSITLGRLLEKMKIEEIHLIHNTHDALFGGIVPNPTKKNMVSDGKLVQQEHFDLAIGTDSDCDRLAILDENGKYVDANEILAALYYYLVNYRHMKGDIVKNLATGSLIDKVAEHLGFACHEVDVGFKNISSTIKKYDALIGGESSGGLTIRGYIFGKDSTFSTALFLEMCRVIGKPVSQIIKEVREFASYYSVIIEDQMNYKDKNYILECCTEKCPKFTRPVIKEVHINNNYKYYFDEGSWALLRFSGTEPVIRIFVEMADEKEALINVEEIKKFVLELECARV